MGAETKSPAPAMSAEDYAKVSAVLARIQGLRMSIVATMITGVSASFGMFWVGLASGLLSLRQDAFAGAASIGLLVLIPFLLVAGFFSYRVNRYIERLTRGKYEPPVVID